MDGKGIQARTQLNSFSSQVDNNLLLNQYGGNVGIGISNPTRAKLELNGTGLGTTTAIFGGDGAGISLQKDWPVIGFNQYFDFNGFTSKYIGNGYAAEAGLNQVNGDFYINTYASGTANTATTGFQNFFNIKQNGRVGLGTISPISKLHVTSGELLYSGISGTGRGVTSDFFLISGLPHTRYTHEKAIYAEATDNAVALEINGPVSVTAGNNQFVFDVWASSSNPSDAGYYYYLGNGYWAINLTGNGSPLIESTFPTIGYILVTPMFSGSLNSPGDFNIPTRGMLWYSINDAKYIVDTEPVQVLKPVMQLRVMVIRKNPDITF